MTARVLAMHERCPTCDKSDSIAIKDLQKCVHCGATWVTGSGLPAKNRSGLDEARNTVIEEAVAAASSLDPSHPLAIAVRVLQQSMADYYG